MRSAGLRDADSGDDAAWDVAGFEKSLLENYGVTPHHYEDLGADSVDLVELVMAMEESFGVGETQEDDLNGLKTVGDAVNYIAGKLK